nr:hypothetical protein CFP56_39827 [Quercus suber]
MAVAEGGALVLKGEEESDLGFRRKFSRSESIMQKRKLSDEKADTTALLSTHVAPQPRLCPWGVVVYHNQLLRREEKAVVATLKVESVGVECPQFKKDLIAVMNKRNGANQKIKELTEALRVEKALVVQKDEEIQATLLKTDDERDKIIQKFK